MKNLILKLSPLGFLSISIFFLLFSIIFDKLIPFSGPFALFAFVLVVASMIAVSYSAVKQFQARNTALGLLNVLVLITSITTLGGVLMIVIGAVIVEGSRGVSPSSLDNPNLELLSSEQDDFKSITYQYYNLEGWTDECEYIRQVGIANDGVHYSKQLPISQEDLATINQVRVGAKWVSTDQFDPRPGNRQFGLEYLGNFQPVDLLQGSYVFTTNYHDEDEFPSEIWMQLKIVNPQSGQVYIEFQRCTF